MRTPLVSTTIDGNVRLAVPHTHAAGHDPQGGYVSQVFGCTTRDMTTLEMGVGDWRLVLAALTAKLDEQAILTERLGEQALLTEKMDEQALLTAKLDEVERRAWESQAADPPAVVEFGGEG